MPLEEIIKAISTVGFPIVMSIYLLIRFEKNIGQELKSLKEAINKLTVVLAKKGIDIDD